MDALKGEYLDLTSIPYLIANKIEPLDSRISLSLFFPSLSVYDHNVIVIQAKPPELPCEYNHCEGILRGKQQSKRLRVERPQIAGRTWVLLCSIVGTPVFDIPGCWSIYLLDTPGTGEPLLNSPFFIAIVS